MGDTERGGGGGGLCLCRVFGACTVSVLYLVPSSSLLYAYARTENCLHRHIYFARTYTYTYTYTHAHTHARTHTHAARAGGEHAYKCS